MMIVVRSARIPSNGWPMEHVGIERSALPASFACASSAAIVAAASARLSLPSFLSPRAQLNQHISTGDSEVDGSESERGGFMGHPMCEFCKSPFYGDNELYSHMSTEHYTCHICQRRSTEQDRRGRGRTFHRDQYDDQISIAIQASLETANSESTSHDPSSSSSAQIVSVHEDVNYIDPLLQPFESLTAMIQNSLQDIFKPWGKVPGTRLWKNLPFPLFL
ncbi:hypothetical protein GH714_022339 [Hevea brasiliensis]|uniref:C2H2-type domain-containing protein n=1 Tax=Hevea brasiliensis TaxID=3981 RepID=A0A6A6NIH2_HEVBR|nr:hypothetical protein GH714_022339 [Hevea brasiliensis]